MHIHNLTQFNRPRLICKHKGVLLLFDWSDPPWKISSWVTWFSSELKRQWNFCRRKCCYLAKGQVSSVLVKADWYSSSVSSPSDSSSLMIVSFASLMVELEKSGSSLADLHILIGSKNTYEWPGVTTNDHEWPRLTTRHHEWPRVTKSDREWD